jgi:DNA-3-methyladenine glycosylase
MANTVLDRNFYQNDPKSVAKSLLGQLLVSTIGGKRAAGIIVETEAYLSEDDSAAHGYRGRNNKNASMFGPAAMAYVYPIHARYCFNCVTQSPGQPSAVLVRALEPITGTKIMQQRRSTTDQKNLCSGPAKLCEALAIDKVIDGWNLTSRRKVWIESADYKVAEIKITPRIGVTSAKEALLRFVVAGNEFASGPKYLR